MGRKSKAKFEMKGHTLPGINQISETENLKDGKSPSSAFQQKSSPNKIIGALAGGLIGGGIGKLFNKNKKPGDDAAGGGGGSSELLKGTGQTIEPVKGFKVSGDAAGGTDATGGDTGTTPQPTTMPEPGGGDAATNEPDEVLPMKSPVKQGIGELLKNDDDEIEANTASTKADIIREHAKSTEPIILRMKSPTKKNY